MMDLNIEEEILISLREMGSSEEEDEFIENRHSIRHNTATQPCRNPSLPHLDLRVFYISMSKCVIKDGSAPEFLRLNHIPLNPDTLQEAGVCSNGVSTVLKRARLDRQSEEVTFVCADSIRTTGSVMFEVFDEDVLVLSGTLERKEESYDPIWSMQCELSVKGFFKGNHSPYMSFESGVEVFVAGCFSGSPILLRTTLQLGRKRKQMRKGMLKPIPECEATESLTSQLKHHTNYKPEEENHSSPHQGLGLGGEEEDGDLSWFNAGVTIGIGIRLTICVGVGLLVRAYPRNRNKLHKMLTIIRF